MPWEVFEDEYRDRVIGSFGTRAEALDAFKVAIDAELGARGEDRAVAIADGRLDYSEVKTGPYDEAQADMNDIGCWHIREV